jgi:hypothetical protein
MDRYQLVPTFDYDDSDDGELIDPHSGDFWGVAADATVAPSSTVYDHPEGDGRSSRNHFRPDDDCEPVYFPKRYGIDAPSDFDEDNPLSRYYHVSARKDEESSTGPEPLFPSGIPSLINASESSLSLGGSPASPIIAFTDQRLAGLSYFDDSDSDDDGAIHGAGGRTLDTISEEDETDIRELEEDEEDVDDGKRRTASDFKDHSDVSDDELAGRKPDAYPRRIGSTADGDDSSYGDMDDAHMNSNGSVVFDCFTRSWTSANGRLSDASLSPSRDRFE